MKILLVSMNSIHFIRWTDQLKNSGHEVHWFNIYDSGYSNQLKWVHQYVGWRYRFKNIKGRFFLKNKFPELYKLLFERSIEKSFETVLKKVQPDLVHSFVLYASCYPILSIIKKHQVKWCYTAWGSDLYYYKNFKESLTIIKEVLPHINYMFSDCLRDYSIAKEYGFVGKYLGRFPGGGGFIYNDKILLTPCKRNIILIKGYENRSGRAIKIIEAIEKIKTTLINFDIVIFSATPKLLNYLKLNKIEGYKVFTFDKMITHNEIINIMSKTKIYIGNSISDGLPNSLFEAILYGAFPIQSTTGGSTDEVITHGKNGFIIRNPLDSEEITKHIKQATSSPKLLCSSFEYNIHKLRPLYERNNIKKEVLQSYKTIENEL